MSPPRTTKPAYRLGLEALAEGDKSSNELAEILGIAKRNVNKYVQVWRAEGIISRRWRRCLDGTPGDFIPLHHLVDPDIPGDDQDEPRPKALTSKQKQRRFRIRHRAEYQLRERRRKGRDPTNPFAQLLLSPIKDDLDRPHGKKIKCHG